MGSARHAPNEEDLVGFEDVIEDVIEDVVDDEGVAAGRTHTGMFDKFAAVLEKYEAHRLEQSFSPMVQVGQLPVHGADMVVIVTGCIVRE